LLQYRCCLQLGCVFILKGVQNCCMCAEGARGSCFVSTQSQPDCTLLVGCCNCGSRHRSVLLLQPGAWQKVSASICRHTSPEGGNTGAIFVATSCKVQHQFGLTQRATSRLSRFWKGHVGTPADLSDTQVAASWGC
jgi:hypothetical protein